MPGVQTRADTRLAAKDHFLPLSAPLSIELAAITKRFGGTVANDSISCTFNAGGVHALLGENGAGKSTLMKILCGYYQPDAGTICLNGAKVTLKSSAEARRRGIGMVHQQFTLVPSMTVLENILLGDTRVPFLIDKKSQLARLQAMAGKLGIAFDFAVPVSALTVAARQKVEILKLLSRDADILILDEPTSQLAAFEAEDILTTIQRLALDGKIVILISHHIDEILRFASRITVLRGGKHVATLDAQAVQAHELAGMMVDTFCMTTQTQRLAKSQRAPCLSMQKVSIAGSAANRPINTFDLDLFSGEILGIAGVIGSGQEEIAALLTGHLAPQSGVLKINGKPAQWSHLKSAKNSAGYVPADAKHSTVASMSAVENSMLRDVHQKDFVSGPFLKHRLIRGKTIERINKFDVRPKHPDTLCDSFSGGNLQRLVVARELDNRAEVFVAVNPTAGLDIAMTQRVLQELQSAAGAGKAVVFVSPDLQELLSTCDRILVMCAGSQVGIEQVEDLDSESLGLLIGGVKLEHARKLAYYLRSQNDIAIDDEIKKTLFSLFETNHTWQRRLACQIAYRSFSSADLGFVETLLVKEENPECRAWLSVLLAKHGGGAHLEQMKKALHKETTAFAEVMKKIWHCNDLPALHAKLDTIGAGGYDGISGSESTLARILRDKLATSEVVENFDPHAGAFVTPPETVLNPY